MNSNVSFGHLSNNGDQIIDDESFGNNLSISSNEEFAQKEDGPPE